MEHTISPPAGSSVVFIDGTCVMCSRIASFIASHDDERRFYFSHLQGDFARDAIARHGEQLDIDVIYCLAEFGTPNERLLADGRAGRFIWPTLFRLAFVLRFVPLPILNFFYWLGARVRFALFGRYEVCTVPTEGVRRRFIDVAAAA